MIDNKKIKQLRTCLIYNIDYVTIILGDLFLIYMFLHAFIEGGVHPLYILLIMSMWFIFNLFCVFYIEILNKKKRKITTVKKTDELKIITTTFATIKYLSLAFVNYLLINSMIVKFLEDHFIPSRMCVIALIYNVFCFGFIWSVSKKKAKEFYSFLLITLPVIIGLIWYIIV